MAVPIVIAHRGVPGCRLEHTRESYELAIAAGADFIEPDVVSTKDNVLVVRHENEIGGTTDIAEHREFAARKTTKVVDGVTRTGWFTEDFTLAELKTLRAKERIPAIRPHNLPLEGTTPILTFDEVLDIARIGDHASMPGVYVETKHPTYFAGIGIDLNDLLIENLERRGANTAAANIIIQSMETDNLRRLRERTPLPLVQLMELGKSPYDRVAAGDPRSYHDMATAGGLDEVARYADGIGPHKGMVIARDKDQRLVAETGIVARAHAVGLVVHSWTMRDENEFLPAEFRSGTDKSSPGDAVAEYVRFFEAGVDGVFTDHAPTAVAARTGWLARRDGVG